MDDRVVPLLRLLFAVPGYPRGWWAFFDALGQAISPDVRAVMLVEVNQPEPATTLFGSDLQCSTPGRVPRRDDGGPRIEALPPGTVFDLPHLPPRIAGHPVVRQLLGTAGLEAGPALGIALGRDATRAAALLLVLPRRKGWKPTPADRALLTALAPFLPQAARLHDSLAGAAAMTALLDRLVLGVVLLDDRGHVSYANRSAAELLGVEPGLSDATPHEGRDPRTEALYRSVSGAGPDEGVRYRHPVDGRPLQLLKTELDWPGEHGMAARRFRHALFFGDPKLHTGDPAENLGNLYGLTPAEARLAWLLVGDVSLAEAAAQLGITESTARTVLKRILAKTGTRRQASLVRLLLSGPGQVRSDARQPQRRSTRSRRRR